MISDTNALSSFASSGLTQSLDVHLSREPDPLKLENWLVVNEARILCHVAHRHTHHRSRQQHITGFFTSTALMTLPCPKLKVVETVMSIEMRIRQLASTLETLPNEFQQFRFPQ
jgi:hypothetical protein